jgi:hypothetical protein
LFNQHRELNINHLKVRLRDPPPISQFVRANVVTLALGEAVDKNGSVIWPDTP